MKIDKLKTVTAFLRRPRTALDLAEHLGSSRPTAYAWIRKAKAKKCGDVRQGVKGPLAATYQVK